MLLVHHSPSASAHPWRKRLQRGAELLAAIAASAHPPHLVLHGHGHGAKHEWLRIGTHDPIPIVQATAASAKQTNPQRAGGYNEFAITASAATSPKRWRVSMVNWHWTDQGMVASAEQTWGQGA